MSFVLYFILVPLIFMVVRVILIILHEMSHAVAALLLTNGDVKVWLGFHKEPEACPRMTFGRLEILFLPNPLQWRGGYCLTTDVDELSLTRHVIIIAAGALGSLVVTVVPFYCALVFHANDLLLWALLVPACAAVLGLGSLIPRKHSMQVGSDGIIYSDGARLLQLLSMRGYHREWMRISRHYREKQYGEAARLLEDLLGRVQKADIHRLAIIVHIMANDMRKADELSERLRARGGMTWGDFVNAGLIKCYLGEHDACLADFERASARDRNNATIHNARGFAMSCMERYAEAIADCDRAIELQPDCSSAYNYRGLARMKMGEVEEGLADIHHALEQDQSDPYIYRNLGIYHIDRGEFSEALELLSKARDINPHTIGLEEYIAVAERGLGKAPDARST